MRQEFGLKKTRTQTPTNFRLPNCHCALCPIINLYWYIYTLSIFMFIFILFVCTSVLCLYLILKISFVTTALVGISIVRVLWIFCRQARTFQITFRDGSNYLTDGANFFTDGAKIFTDGAKQQEGLFWTFWTVHKVSRLLACVCLSTQI